MSDPIPTEPLLAKARLPRGLVDRHAQDIAATDRIISSIRETYRLYGFEPVETPFIEYTDALGKFLPDLDRPNEGVFSFKDDDESWLSLRYDLTAPLARFVAENYQALPKPYRSYRAGYVFRNEKPGPGRFRQFMQFDADTVGSASVAADAEFCMMAADCLERLGIGRGDYVLKVNNRKVLDGVMEAIGLGGAADAGRRLTVLRAIDKLDRLGPKGVAALLGSGRKDDSGDFTKGAGLDAAEIERVLAFTGAGQGQTDATLAALRAVVGRSERGLEGVAELEQIAALVAAAGYDDGRVRIDPSVVRGLEYYTGPVFEAELTFAVPGDDGKPVRFGSVGGGGRYDGLVARFRGEVVPATGFSIGISRLQAALKAVGSPIVAHAAPPGPVVVTVLDRDQLARYQALVTMLRQAGIAAELYLGGSGLNAQLKYADKRGSLCAVLQGSNERDAADGATVVIRDLVLGAELGRASKDRSDYVELRQKAQATVPEARLVEAVREVLARHATA
ncbi:histidine--tRNA ligase [Lichenihabitans sp. Uapishka_5]|uniref:histidine--tRNA ligase n=1 Tax=Lichenihabitans sp. Uapishka_5 TaxID=3037302 RepID=UPI0029E7E65B|nr:histidine--tRNA ligase [Lichenihabitans sp. Uapishka_5]MDX7949873.1 histidine--tRNA ligase [Lichenihabitans sp. Uapishka_5]